MCVEKENSSLMSSVYKVMTRIDKSKYEEWGRGREGGRERKRERERERETQRERERCIKQLGGVVIIEGPAHHTDPPDLDSVVQFWQRDPPTVGQHLPAKGGGREKTCRTLDINEFIGEHNT